MKKLFEFAGTAAVTLFALYSIFFIADSIFGDDEWPQLDVYSGQALVTAPVKSKVDTVELVQLKEEAVAKAKPVKQEVVGVVKAPTPVVVKEIVEVPKLIAQVKEDTVAKAQPIKQPAIKVPVVEASTPVVVDEVIATSEPMVQVKAKPTTKPKIIKQVIIPVKPTAPAVVKETVVAPKAVVLVKEEVIIKALPVSPSVITPKSVIPSPANKEIVVDDVVKVESVRPDPIKPPVIKVVPVVVPTPLVIKEVITSKPVVQVKEVVVTKVEAVKQEVVEVVKVIAPEPTNTASPESIAKGKKLFTNLACSSCHGASAQGVSAPALTGKTSDWVYSQLKAFQKGERNSPVMRAMSLQAIDNERAIGDFLETLK